MYTDQGWIPEFRHGDLIKTDYNTIKVINVYREQIYNVQIIGDHGVHLAKMTESFLNSFKENNVSRIL